jgi:hypothetical protein
MFDSLSTYKKEVVSVVRARRAWFGVHIDLDIPDRLKAAEAKIVVSTISLFPIIDRNLK